MEQGGECFLCMELKNQHFIYHEHLFPLYKLH
jgi:hypothetical protein